MKQIFESDHISYAAVSEDLLTDYLIMVNDNEHVGRFIGGRHEPYSEEKERKWVREKLEENAQVFSMIEKNSGQFIGNVELMDVHGTAAELGIDQVWSNLLPGDKVTKVEELLAEKPEKEMLAFVGDGINDAPVLGRADLGIAMGAMGSDAAIEAADVVLMDDNPLKISKSIRIARKCMRIVYQNIILALCVKAVCLVLGALGIANMWLAVFADVGVMIIAVLNAIRALFVSKL